MLFHVLYQDLFFKSDCHLVIDAENEKKALEKVQHYLKSKHAEHTTVQFLRQSKFAKTYAHSSFFKIFFQNGNGYSEKHCQILAENQEVAEKIFADRFSSKEIIRIEHKKILSCIEKKQPKKINFEGITAQPLAAVA